MPRVEIVPLRHEHLADWYGADGYSPTVKGVAGFVDGKLAAVGGLWLVKGKVIAFCNLREEARACRKSLHKTALNMLAEAKTRHKRITAQCDPSEPTAPAWLRRLGFQEGEEGEWEWRTSV